VAVIDGAEQLAARQLCRTGETCVGSELLLVQARSLIVWAWSWRCRQLRMSTAQMVPSVARSWGKGCGGDPVRLAGDDLGEQPDGESGVAAGAVGFGPGERGGGLTRGIRGQDEPRLGRQGGEDRAELAGGIAREANPPGQARLAIRCSTLSR
jgi:hypothetical protein